jgi:DNA-binding HxlR family transcriptional regulator
MSTDPPPKRHPYNQWAPDARALDLVGDKWTLLIIRDLAAGARRFVELQRVLPGISTEQLRSRLKRMVADGLLTRERFREVPPRVEYALTERAYDLLPVVGALARWGQAWAWSPPREGEAIDISAVFRAAPGLLAPDRKLSGEVELSVGGASRPSVIEFRDGRATVSERAAPNASARVAGARQAWIDALGPRHDRSGLRMSGDERLARAVLDGLADTSHGVSQVA